MIPIPIPVRWVELPDCPTCPRVWPTYMPWLIAGSVVAVILIIALSIVITMAVNRRSEMREYQIRNTHHCPTCGDVIEGTPVN